MTTPVPGPPAAVLSAILAGSGAQPGGRAVFSASNAPDLPMLQTEVVWLPQFAELQANVQVVGTLISQGWATGNVTAVSGNYTPLPTDAVILASAAGGALTVTLPDATQPGFFAGQRYSVIKTDSTANAVTVNASAGQLISGQASVTLSNTGGYTAVVFDGANWWVWTGYTTTGSAPSGPAGGALSGTYPNPGLALESGMQFLTGGGSLTLSMITSAQTAGYQGIFLDPRYVWNAGGLVLSNISDFTIESRMSGSIGYSNTIAYNTGGYIATGSGADGIQVYGTTGGGAQGLTFRGVCLVGSNTNAVLHLGGRHRRIRVENSFIYNTASTAGAYAVIDDTALNNANGEDNCFSHCDIAGAYAAIGIGIADQTQHVNDSLWSDITTSGGTYSIVMNAGGNHHFLNYYDRSMPSVAQVWNHGGNIIFIGGENGNSGVNGGVTYLQDNSGANTVLVNATVTAGATSPSNILNLSSGNFSCLGKMRSNNACTFNLTGGTLYLADPASGLGNVTVSGSGGSLWLADNYMGSGNAPAVTWTGTPTMAVGGTGAVASGHANAQTTTQSVSWTPPSSGARFRASVWLQVTTAGTSTVPSLSFTQYQGTAFSANVPMWQMNGSAAAPTYTCAATGTYMGSFMGETDGSGAAVTLTITPTGSTYRYSVVIERLT